MSILLSIQNSNLQFLLDPFLLKRFHVWLDGYERNKLETPVYSDVAIQIQKWRCDLKIRLYAYSSSWSDATRCFLSKTNHGDLNLLIDGCFDTTLGPSNVTTTYEKVLDSIKQKPENVLFLTKSTSEAQAALKAGISVVLVLTHRRSQDQLNDSNKGLPTIRSFNELDFETENN